MLRTPSVVRRRIRSWALSQAGVRKGRGLVRRWWATRPGVRTLVLANVYGRPESVPEVAPLIANIERLAQGRLRVVFANGWTSRQDPDEERSVLQDVANGVVDLGWVGARAVGAVLGIRSLEPLHAPLLFSDEREVGRFIMSGEVAPLLGPLQEVGLVGVALLPGGLRRPFGLTMALVGAEDWRGKVIRTHSSLAAEAALRALGATPVLLPFADFGVDPPRGIDGMDLHPKAVAAYGYAGWLTWNVPLWPRLVLVVANRRRIERLGPSDRTLLDEAALRATAEIAGDPRCFPRVKLSDSVTLVEASEYDLASLRFRLGPVYDELRSTSEGERTITQIERLAHPRHS